MIGKAIPILLGALALPGIASAALVLDNGRVTFVHAKPSGAIAPFARRTRAPAIYENFAHSYRKGEYNASTGASLSGPNTLHGQIWLAAAFTPASTVTLKEIVVAAGYINGAKNVVDVHLYADAAGIPGAEIWSHKTALPSFGTCCTAADLTPRNVTLTANTQYWLGITTPPGATTTSAAWNLEVLDQVTPATLAQNRGSGWVANPSAPDFAFGVYGE